MNSSPAQNIGVPFERNRRAQKFFTWRRRSAATAGGTSSSPSQPQFQLTLWSWPSALPSPFARLCFSL